MRYSQSHPNQKKFSTLADYRERIDSGCTKTHSYVSGIFQDEPYILKVTSCVWGEALQNVEDPELMFYLICYRDYFSAKNANENFLLTRKETILQGGAMCDFCYHNLQLTKNPKHPNEEFWETLD
jgi:hypothetical protein